MDSRYRFLTLGTPWTQSMPSRDVNAVTRLAEASWWRDNCIKELSISIRELSFSIRELFISYKDKKLSLLIKELCN